MSKAIKKILKISLIAFSSIIFIPVIAYLLFIIPYVQTYIGNIVADQISEVTRTPISIKGVDIHGLRSFSLKGLYIEDYKKDTLIYVDKLNVKLDSVNLNNSSWYINKIVLKKMFFNLHENKNSILNIEHFIDSLSKGPSDPNKKAIDLHFKNISIRNSRFIYEVEDYKEVDYEINWEHILVDDLNVDIENLYFKDGVAYFYGKSISLKERTGFVLDRLSGKTALGPGFLNVDNLLVKTAKSQLHLSTLRYKWVPGRRDWSNFLTNMDQEYVLNDSYASFEDIAHFNGKLQGFREVVRGKGTVYGTISSLKGKNLELSYRDNTSLVGDFASSGLPNIFDAKYNVNFDKLDIDIKDIEKMYIPWKEDNRYMYWEKFKNLGIMSYYGSFAGSFKNFKCAGILSSDAGSIITNVNLNPFEDTENLSVNGFVQFLDFNVGVLLDKPSFGIIKLDTRLNGSFDKTAGFIGTIDGNISELNILDYAYHNLSLKGNIDKKKFFGELDLKDENVSMHFMGGIDFNDKFPVANFKSKIENANLKNLHLYNNDILLSLDVKADFTGNSFDNFNGSINISNTLCSNLRDSIMLDNFSFYTGVTDNISNLTLKSDFAHFTLRGDYEFSSILDDFKDVLYKKLPNYKPEGYIFRYSNLNKFELSLELHNTEDILRIFYPSIRLSDNTRLSWNHYCSKDLIEMNIDSPYIIFKGNRFEDLSVKIKSDSLDLVCETSVGTLNYAKSYNIHNLRNVIKASDNVASTILSWNNWEASTFGGFFSAKAEAKKNPNGRVETNINFDEGSIIVGDSIWTFKPSTLNILDKYYRFDNLMIYKDDHSIGLNGILSENSEDSLSILFSKCDVDKIADLLNLPIDNVKGRINGFINISDIYAKPKVTSDIRIEDIYFGKKEYGDVMISSQWDNKYQRLNLDAYSINKNRKGLSINGWYQPSSETVDLNVKIDSLDLEFIKPHVTGLFKDMNGSVNAEISLSSSLQKPIYRGYIHLANTDFTLKGNNSKYFCNDTIHFATKNVVFDNFVFKDDELSIATLAGNIKLDKNAKFDLLLSMNKFKIFDASSLERPDLYGKVYLSGKAQLFGLQDDLDINVDVKTEKGTDINVSLSKGNSISSSEFISFINSSEITNDHLDNLSSIDNHIQVKDYSNINLNCNLEVTEDANTQIIFNEKLGDAIKANGNGDLNIKLSKNGDFGISGTYTVIKGSYLFTLQNMAVSKFILAKGGTIKWSGSPYDALIDLNAIYKLRTSLYNLMPDNKDPNISIYQKIPVNCIINLRNQLSNPAVNFSIDFPSLNQQNKSYVQSLFRSQDDINKQFIYLLVLNRFNTPEYVVMEEDTKSNASVGITTASELLSNQFSTWLSQISDDFDFGFKYRPKDEISSDEIELALSTQLFSNRVTLNVNGNIDTGNNEQAVTRNNTIIGDFDIEWKLSRDGNLRFKAYSRTNDQMTYKLSKTTQGVGIQYQEEFNSFSELVSNYFSCLFGRKKEE
jgi:hypothetical protein